MTNLTIQLPDELVRDLEAIAAMRRQSVEQLAIERLTSLAKVRSGVRIGSAAAVLRVMQEPPHPSAADADELDAAITAGRLAMKTIDPFSGRIRS